MEQHVLRFSDFVNEAKSVEPNYPELISLGLMSYDAFYSLVVSEMLSILKKFPSSYTLPSNNINGDFSFYVLANDDTNFNNSSLSMAMNTSDIRKFGGNRGLSVTCFIDQVNGVSRIPSEFVEFTGSIPDFAERIVAKMTELKVKEVDRVTAIRKAREGAEGLVIRKSDERPMRGTVSMDSLKRTLKLRENLKSDDQYLALLDLGLAGYDHFFDEVTERVEKHLLDWDPKLTIEIIHPRKYSLRFMSMIVQNTDEKFNVLAMTKDDWFDMPVPDSVGIEIKWVSLKEPAGASETLTTVEYDSSFEDYCYSIAHEIIRVYHELQVGDIGR